jgi:heme exporter protein D
MIWNNWNDFFAMGGYAPYVWGALGVVFGAMAAEIWILNQRVSAVLVQLRATGRRVGGRR